MGSPRITSAARGLWSREVAPRLYPIVDVDALGKVGLPPLDFAEAVLALSPRWLQLRAKSMPPAEIVRLARRILPACEAAGTQLFLNDRPDLAVATGCHGVHVGQDDLTVMEVRSLFPGLRVGVSTHTEVELGAALASGPDYVAFGPVFATGSKLHHEPTVGIRGLRSASVRCRAVGVPLVAIGGITAESVAEVAPLVEGVALIGALVRPDRHDVRIQAERLAGLLSDLAS
jgi:thiamine-phosphate pyrophosphorylase